MQSLVQKDEKRIIIVRSVDTNNNLVDSMGLLALYNSQSLNNTLAYINI